MGGLSTKVIAVQWIKQTSIILIGWAWNTRQLGRALIRTFGAWEWCLIFACISTLVSIGVTVHLRSQVRILEWKRANPQSGSPAVLVKVDALSLAETKQRLQDFERVLIPHENIPQVLGDLLRLAEDEGLLIRRADYRPTDDTSGHFMRYRINMPIKGKSESIHRYLRGAMHAQRNLILESVQLKREASESDDMEANVRWVLLTRLPLENAVGKKARP
ncbi:hypothetical protein [Iodobacter ciconiae]|uniref:Transmembrane protein n=1 Tax=Iodobacter ciconiae TaxID=2496266 RepID=A0A3S8ZPS4_9NEIS|nr:hypothetical protein [Iodobacter ciconiae]AZN35473.1 hypothetical protein EJO50_02610 [Iodobacter ciconiae]